VFKSTNRPPERPVLRDNIWGLVEPSLDGYGQLIDMLIARCPIDKLKEIIHLLADEDEESE
jgi:hypothetical protein